MEDRAQENNTDDSLFDRVRQAAQFEEQHTPDEGGANNVRVDPSEDLDDVKQDYEIEQIKEQLKELGQGRRHADDVHKMRKSFAPYLFGLVCVWLVIVAVAVFFSGFEFKGFKLNDKVIIAFIATTTANVLGLFYVVAKWLYPNNGSHTSSKKNDQ